jgi:hypothetical protein
MIGQTSKASPYPHANPDAVSRGNVSARGTKFEPVQIVATPVALEALRSIQWTILSRDEVASLGVSAGAFP